MSEATLIFARKCKKKRGLKGIVNLKKDTSGVEFYESDSSACSIILMWCVSPLRR